MHVGKKTLKREKSAMSLSLYGSLVFAIVEIGMAVFRFSGSSSGCSLRQRRIFYDASIHFSDSAALPSFQRTASLWIYPDRDRVCSSERCYYGSGYLWIDF